MSTALEQERAKGALAVDAPAKLIEVHKDRRSAAVAEALFQRRKRFKRAIDSMREGSLTSAEQVAELGSEQGAQEVLLAAIFWANQRIGERLGSHARKKSARWQVETAAAMLSGKRIHIDAAVQKGIPQSPDAG